MEEKECKICNSIIKEDDHQVELKEINNMDLVSVGYYHIQCFRNRYFANQKVSKQAKHIFDKAEQLIGRLS